MRILMVLTLALIANSAHALLDCSDLKRERLQVAVHASNLANAKTTRTPEGGPWAKKQVLCEKQDCEIKSVKEFKTVYSPGHPDADENGYVKYPDISVAQEYSALSASVGILKIMARASTCNAEILQENKRGIVLKYSDDQNTMLDQFTISDQGKLVSWSREDRRGGLTSMNFSQTGEAVRTR